LTAIFVGWILAPVTAWITSWRGLGQWLRSHGLFVTPEECRQPEELKGLDRDDNQEQSQSPAPLWPQALLCPYVLAIHLSMVRQRSSSRSVEMPAPSLINLRERLIKKGPSALQPKEKLRLLWDAETVFWLHRELWARPEASLHSSWLGLESESGKNTLLHNYLMAPTVKTVG